MQITKKLLALLYLVCLFLPSCISSPSTVPSFAASTIEIKMSTNTAQRTATPTFRPITAEPTFTPLYREKEIATQDYGQQLILFIGDKFTIFRSADDQGPLAIDNPDVLRAITDNTASSVVLQAVGLGHARVSYLFLFPCPTPPHCQPPANHTYLLVTVINH